MAIRVYGHDIQTQDERAEVLKKSFEAVMHMGYGGEQEQMIGEQIWGNHEFDQEGLHNEWFVHTRLIGTALKTDDSVRLEYPMARFETGEILVQGLNRLGIMHEYYPEDLEDVLANMDFVVDLVDDLPILLRDAEEEEHHFHYNNGETDTTKSGVFGTRLFCDGTGANVLQLLGDSTYFSGTAASNIINGGISYATFELLHQYGDNFINEERRPEALSPVLYVCSPQNADKIAMFYDATFNIESGNPNQPNPLRNRPRPNILSTKRMANRMDMWVFFGEWQRFMKERSKWRGRSASWTEGNEQFQKVVAQTRSRYGYYHVNNRNVVLVKGAA